MGDRCKYILEFLYNIVASKYSYVANVSMDLQTAVIGGRSTTIFVVMLSAFFTNGFL